MQKKEYFKAMFEDEKSIYLEKDRDRLKEAYERAHDIRKFEIELYWKRATFFWAFELVALGGFGTYYGKWLSTESTIGICIALYLIALGGFIITYLWCCVLHGSKFWQENWEKHIDMLEEYFSGNLYKIGFTSNEKMPFSVSKISRYISYIFMCYWILAIIFSICLIFELPKYNTCILVIVSILFLLTIVGIFLNCFSKTSFLRGHPNENYNAMIFTRKVIDD